MCGYLSTHNEGSKQEHTINPRRAASSSPPPTHTTQPINNRALQDRVFAEQQSVLGSQVDKPLDFDDVGKMDLLFNCLRETLRMHPPLIMLMRKCRQDLPVNSEDGKSYTVPKVRLSVLWSSVPPSRLLG